LIMMYAPAVPGYISPAALSLISRSGAKFRKGRREVKGWVAAEATFWAG
jgi:hypothetical protein